MKRFAPCILAGLIACFAPLAQVAAQETEIPVTAGQPAGEPVPFSEEPTLLYATELMQRAELYAEAIAEVSQVPEVEVLGVSKLPRVDTSLAVFEDTMDRFTTYYRAEIAALRDAIADNPVIADALDEAGVDLSDVLAAEIRPDLALRVYIRDW